MPTPEQLQADFQLVVEAHDAFNLFHGITESESMEWWHLFGLANAADATDEQRHEAMRLMQAVEDAIVFRSGSKNPAPRIAFHDGTQEAVKIISPTHRFIWQLMAGGYTRNQRHVRDEGPEGARRPVLEGTGEIMGPMTFDEAVAFVAWKDMPRGVNHYAVLSTDDLPRIDGDIDRARKFRGAWRLELQEAA